MATATFSGQYGRNMSLELKAELTGQNIAGNYSSVHVTAYLHTNGYASMWGVSADATITINGGSAYRAPRYQYWYQFSTKNLGPYLQRWS